MAPGQRAVGGVLALGLGFAAALALAGPLRALTTTEPAPDPAPTTAPAPDAPAVTVKPDKAPVPKPAPKPVPKPAPRPAPVVPRPTYREPVTPAPVQPVQPVQPVVPVRPAKRTRTHPVPKKDAAAPRPRARPQPKPAPSAHVVPPVKRLERPAAKPAGWAFEPSAPVVPRAALTGLLIGLAALGVGLLGLCLFPISYARHQSTALLLAAHREEVAVVGAYALIVATLLFVIGR